MNPNKNLQFLKRWRDLEVRQKDLDIEKARWCADLRGEYPDGSAGDHQFLDWLEVELGISASLGEELLDRARAAKIVPDKTTWDRVGGYKNVRLLIPLKPRDRVAVLEATKVESKAIRTVLRDRDLAAKPAAPAAKPDVVTLAEYVASIPGVPYAVRAIALKYVKQARRAA